MSVAQVGAVTTFNIAGSGITKTLNYTLNAAANMLLVRVHFYPGAGETLDGVTWGGVALTSVGTVVSGSGSHRVQMWRLVNPTTGTDDIVATFSASTFYCVMGATGYSGVNTSIPTSSYQTGSGTSASSPASIDPVTSSSGHLVVSALTRDDDAGMTGVNQTNDYALLDTDPFLVGCGGSASGASSVDPGWSYTGTATWVMCSVSIQGDPDPPGPDLVLRRGRR